MHKGFKLAVLASALSMATAGASFAAGKNDLLFGGWSVSNGDVTTGAGSVCGTGSGFDCSIVAEGKGFRQIQVSSQGAQPVDEEGVSYIMTIVTDQDATGQYGDGSLGFADVSFVQMKITTGGTTSGNVNGIFSEQVISETATGSEFTSTSNISTGWAESIAGVTTPVKIEQTLVDFGAAGTGDDFKSGFYYSSSNDATTGARNGFMMSIDQSAGLATATDPNSVNDVQVFAFRERQGALLTGASNVSLGTNSTVSWTGGDDIKAAWIGQKIALGSGTGSLGGDFGYLSFQNVTTDTTISEFGFAATNADSARVWNEAFVVPGPSDGTTMDIPCLADPSGVNC